MANRIAIMTMLVLALAAPLNARAEWDILHFEAFAGAPYQRGNGAVGSIGFALVEMEDLFPNFNADEVEDAFHEAARWLSNRGFPEPVLEPVLNEDYGPAYRVYVCSEAFWLSMQADEFVEQAKNLGRRILGEEQRGEIPRWSNCGRNRASKSNPDPKSDWAAYNGPCAVSHGARPVFFINADGPAFKNGKLTARGYQTVAHELFHAVQANTVMGRSAKPCSWNGWIMEGMADAVATKMLEDLWPIAARPKDDGWVSKEYGVRPYSKTMPLDPSGYPVSSFWSFLADLNGESFSYLVTEKAGEPGVLDFEITGGGNWKSEADWLDSGLYSKFNMHLNELLGWFMNDYALRIPPMSWTTPGKPEKDVPRFVKAVMGPCAKITLTPTQPKQKFSRTLAPLAGSCAWVTLNVSQASAQVTLQTVSNDTDLFKDVWVGVPHGNALLSQAAAVGQLSQAATVGQAPSGEHIGAWLHFPVPANTPVLMTFTNAATDPTKTKPRTVDFEISIPASTVNLRGGAPAGPGKAAPPALKPSNRRHAQSIQQKNVATKRMIAEQKRLDKDALSPFASASTSVSIDSNVHNCRQPFKYEACGPSLAIRLELMPGTAYDIWQAAGSGGQAAQMFSSFMGQALSNPFDAQMVMTEMAEKLENIDGGSVTLNLPYVDYGYTGSFSNAQVQTTVGGIFMTSIDRPDESNRTPLNGVVSIEEYTPTTLRGSFSASLAYFEQAANGEMEYRSGPMINGTFNIVAPWMEDRRVEHVQLQSVREMADDIGKALGVPPQTMRNLRERGAIPDGDHIPGTGSAAGSGATLGVKDQGCDCACGNQGTLDELCEFFCEEDFAACKD